MFKKHRFFLLNFKKTSIIFWIIENFYIFAYQTFFIWWLSQGTDTSEK